MCALASALELNAPRCKLPTRRGGGGGGRDAVVEEARGGIGERGVVVGLIKSEL